MYENTFKRVEEKYLLTSELKEKLFSRIEEYIEKDKYHDAKICNLYFDNDKEELINTSIDKPIFKHKVRVRSYDIPKYKDDVFLEIKVKYKKIVSKRRIRLSLKEFKEYLKRHKYDHRNQIMKEIDYLFKLYNLKPSYFIAYDRKSYHGIDDINLRITIDSNLRSRKDNLNFEYGDKGELYFDNETYIMEIKTLSSMPLWLVRSLSELKIYPVSFSKYGSIYKKDKVKEC